MTRRGPGPGLIIFSPEQWILPYPERYVNGMLTSAPAAAPAPARDLSPMKAQDLKPLLDWDAADPFAGIAEYLTAGWVAEEKIDGCRAQLVMGETANRFGGMRAASFPHLRDAVVPGLAGTILDGEFTAAPAADGHPLLGTSAGLFNSGTRRAAEAQRLSGPAVFHVFDVLAVCGEDVTGHTYDERRRHLAIVVEWIRRVHPGCQVILVPQLPATAATIREVIGRGGEGVMLKRRSSRYHPGRRVESWQKVKASATAEGFVTGWRPGEGYNTGKVGSVQVSVMAADGRAVPVGHMNIPAAWRNQVTGPDGTLRPEVLGTVVEFTGHGVGLRSGTVNLPIFHRLRPDKTAADCDAAQLDGFLRV